MISYHTTNSISNLKKALTGCNGPTMNLRRYYTQISVARWVIRIMPSVMLTRSRIFRPYKDCQLRLWADLQCGWLQVK